MFLGSFLAGSLMELATEEDGRTLGSKTEQGGIRLSLACN